jgi:hypothetical protein
MAKTQKAALPKRTSNRLLISTQTGRTAEDCECLDRIMAILHICSVSRKVSVTFSPAWVNKEMELPKS